MVTKKQRKKSRTWAAVCVIAVFVIISGYLIALTTQDRHATHGGEENEGEVARAVTESSAAFGDELPPARISGNELDSSSPSPLPSGGANDSFIMVVTTAPTEMPTPATVRAQSIALDASTLSLYRNDVYSLTCTILPAEADDGTTVWKSDAPGIVSLDQRGRLTAHAAGTATITAIKDSLIARCVVTVAVPVGHVTVSFRRNTYKIGESFAFDVQVYPEDATDKSYTVKVSNDNAVLLGNDMVRCVFPGPCSVVATANNGIAGQRQINIVDLDAFALEVFNLTNDERLKHGIDALTRVPNLTAAAALRAKECITQFSHTRPNGKDCFTAFAESDVPYFKAGENIAAGYDTPAGVVKGWMDSDGHRENMLDGGFGHIGIGIDMDSDGKLYWTQLFTN